MTSSSDMERWPSFSNEEREAVSKILSSGRVNYWTGGEGRLFEKEFADWTGCDHAVAVSNGTVALEMALEVLGIGPGHEVVVTSRTFIASASCILRLGAMPVFADVDRQTQNITAQSIAAVMTERCRAIICVHLAGQPCDMYEIIQLARRHKCSVIEDCAQAHGARYRGRPVGGIGDIGTWSFCQDKIMSTGGEGGMVTTCNRELWSRLWSLKDHGKSYEAVYQRSHAPGFRWLHESIGTNFRMTEMQSAIGRIQLRKMSAWHAARKRNALAIREAASDAGVFRLPSHGCNASCPPGCTSCEHAHYKTYLFVEPEKLGEGWNRDRIIETVESHRVPCFTGSCSQVYRERAFDGHPARPAVPLRIAAELEKTSMMLLVHPTLSPDNLDRTCAAIRDAGRRSAKRRESR